MIMLITGPWPIPKSTAPYDRNGSEDPRDALIRLIPEGRITAQELIDWGLVWEDGGAIFHAVWLGAVNAEAMRILGR